MTNLQKVLQGLQDNSEVKANLARAKGKYEDKPFALEYSNTYKAVAKWGWLPSLLSVAGASLAFITLMPNLPIYIPLLLGGLLAGGYEALKAWGTGIGFRAYFKHRALLAVALVALLYLGSVVISTYGAYNGYTLLQADKVGNVLGEHQSSIDSLDSYYGALVDDARQTLAKFEKQHTIQAGKYAGQITWSMKADHAKMVDKVATLKDEHREALQALKAKQPSIVSKAKQSMGAYLYLALAVALIIEIVIFAFRYFAEYYDYRSNKEVDLLQKGDVLQVDTRSLEKLAMLLGAGGSPVPQLSASGADHGQQRGGIGFKPSQTSQLEQPQPQSDKGGNLNNSCKNCGSSYTPSVSWQKYCSQQCREEFNNSKKQ